MNHWTDKDLLKLDARYAKEGVHLHQRPFRAALDVLGSEFMIGHDGNSEVSKIIDAYVKLIPETNTSWPGGGIGLAVSVDRVRKLTLPVVFGGPQSIQPWQATGFKSAEEWWDWCRKDYDIASEASFAFADLWDFAAGLNDVNQKNVNAMTLWQMAASNLEDIANILQASFNVDSVVQPICLLAELAIKGALVFDGAKTESFKGNKGHDLKGLAERMVIARPHRDDRSVALVVSKFPPYVQSRYRPAGLTRLEVARLALSAQFLAASSVRRISSVDIAAQMEAGGWPSPRRPFF